MTPRSVRRRRVPSIREQPIYDAVVGVPFGRLGVALSGARLARVDFLDRQTPIMPPRTPAARAICRELEAYLANPRHAFRAPLAASGTPFQRRVWRALKRIRPGQVRSYGELAHQLETSARAIGLACRANPIALVIPCHRVVARGGIGGFMGRTNGAALDVKRWLLAHERAG